ncbi:Scarecrow-like protein 15 [Vitis vinifera]|uniref:Scarecrow-like protein 15 n=1 Tax=Vitis vinifera TaxID=29760 RepID=A0A438GP15_VITVI|nr:Scarecrow-like protein 15 [Vitis vinifera]
MKVPVPAQNNHSPNPKPLSCNNTTRNTAFRSPATDTINLCYEPTSVLDLRRSPSPVADKAATFPGLLPSPTCRCHCRRSLLGPCDPQFPHLPLPDLPPSQPIYHTQLLPFDFTLSEISSNQNHNFNLNSFHWNVGSEFVEELIRAAECFGSNNSQLAQAILARLNQRLRAPVGKPLQRAAFYFKEALHSLLTGSNRKSHSSASEIVQTIKAYKAFSMISPIAMFSNFTASQALLEAVDGSLFIHIIDFDIGLGGQYASFMKEIADRSEACKVNPPVLRITAVVPEEYAVESRLIKENLFQFAQELKIEFRIEFVLIPTFEVLSFKAVKFIDGEKTAVNISPAIFRRLGTTNNIAGFFCDLRRISPQVVVDAGIMDAGGAGAGGDWVRKIEMSLIQPKIFAAVGDVGRRVTAWRELFSGAGLGQVQWSQFAESQAECLLGKSQVRGFHVAKRQAEMLLCWHGKPLVATSAWRWL